MLRKITTTITAALAAIALAGCENEEKNKAEVPELDMEEATVPQETQTSTVEGGSRSKAEILAIVNAGMPNLTNIYKKHLNLKPGFSGKVTIQFTVDPNGDIINIAIVSSTTGYPEFDNAIKDAVATWKWKPIKKGGNTTPTIPFNFEE
jgi:TonB family protein